MRKILIIGSAYHCEQITKSLNKNFEFKTIVISKKTIFKYYLLLLWADIVLNVYPFTLSRKFSFFIYNIPIFFGKKFIIEWIGTDVLDYKHYLIQNKEPYWMSRVRHLCECSWISAELKTLNVKSTVGPYLVFNTLFQNRGEVKLMVTYDNKLKVLSYVPALRADFYGFDKIIKIAQLLPDVEFTLLRIKESDVAIHVPENIKLLGDINSDQMNALYEQHDVFLRLTDHDGLSYSVLEAMYRGQYVFFTYNYPNTIHASSIDSIVDEVNKLHDLKKSNQLQKNYKAIQYIQDNFILNQICVKNWLEVINEE